MPRKAEKTDRRSNRGTSRCGRQDPWFLFPPHDSENAARQSLKDAQLDTPVCDCVCRREGGRVSMWAKDGKKQVNVLQHIMAIKRLMEGQVKGHTCPVCQERLFSRNTICVTLTARKQPTVDAARQKTSWLSLLIIIMSIEYICWSFSLLCLLLSFFPTFKIVF